MGKKIKLEPKEIKFAFAGLALIMFWFLFARPFIAPYLQQIPPIFAMLVFAVGLLAGLLLISSLLNGNAFHIKFSLITFIVLLGINILSPPYLVAQDGTIHTEVDYWYVSTDASIATTYSYIIPHVNIFGYDLIWILTYILTPALLMVVIPIIISDPTTIRKAMR